MRVLVTGASGLIGQRLLPVLLARGHTSVALSRNPAAHQWPHGVEAVRWDGVSVLPELQADAVVNLMGERDLLPERPPAAALQASATV